MVAGDDAQANALDRSIHIGALVRGGRYSGGTVGATLYTDCRSPGRVSEDPGWWFTGWDDVDTERHDNRLNINPVGFVISETSVFLFPSLMNHHWSSWMVQNPGGPPTGLPEGS